jgi:hypothetical protein
VDFNNFYNNTADVSNVTKGSSDIALNPSFTNVTQVTFSNGTTSGSVLTSSGADFSGVVDNSTYLYLKSGTGITAGVYLITGHTADTLTLHAAPGTNATADKVGQFTLGKNFAVGTNMKAVGPFGALPGAYSTNYNDIGAVQRQESSSSGGGSYAFCS